MGDVRIYTTCPQSKHCPAHEYLAQVVQCARWSDAAGCDGMLIYADNSIVDPWLVAQIAIQQTKRLAPLVAVQPIYLHPYAVAKMVVSLGLLYQRQVCLNLIAGGFRGDLTALGDPTAHDARYARLTEYCQIIQALLSGESVTYRGQYYKVEGLRLTPALMTAPPHILMSGSSAAGRAAATALAVTAVEYPEPAGQIDDLADLPPQRGIRVGLIAADDHAAAWQAAWDRFPGDRRGQLQHALASQVSDSTWHHRLDAITSAGPYWLWPYQNYQTFCPYLVGDYPTVAAEIARYLRLGYKTFILDIPRAECDLAAAVEVFRQAEGLI